MKAELPDILREILPESVLNRASRLSKEMLRRQAASVKGDKALIDAALSALLVMTVRQDTAGIPPYSGEDAMYKEVLVILAELQPGTKKPQRERLQQIIHAAVSHYPLLLIMKEADTIHLSILHASTPCEHIVRLTLDSPAEAMRQDMKQALYSPHLKALFERWICAMQAQKLVIQPPFPQQFPAIAYYPQQTPQISTSLTNSLREAVQAWKQTQSALKQTQNPQERINLAKERRRIAALIHQLHHQYHLIPS